MSYPDQEIAGVLFMPSQSIERTIQDHCQTLSVASPLSLQPIRATFCFTKASLQALQKQKTAFLHPEELAYYNTLLFEKRQHSYLMGRYVGKKAIISLDSDHAALSPADILIKPGVFGQPIVYYQPRKICPRVSSQKIQISLSHCDHLGVSIAFSESCPMGIDLESIAENHQKPIASQLTVKEKEWIRRCDHTNQKTLHTLFWTLKEALSKVLRTGMTSPCEIYAIKNSVYKDKRWITEFENFGQYGAISFLLKDTICSIVYPKQIQLNIDILAIQ